MAVMAYTSYVFLMALPLMLLLPMLGELPWGMTFLFLGLELAFGAFAAAWGLFCSIQCLTVRRALGWALGGILVLMLGGPLLNSVISGLAMGTDGGAHSAETPRHNDFAFALACPARSDEQF